jgi:hypothetical protein
MNKHIKECLMSQLVRARTAKYELFAMRMATYGFAGGLMAADVIGHREYLNICDLADNAYQNRCKELDCEV